MTPRNPLDDKVIIDREVLEILIAIAKTASTSWEATIQAAEQALAKCGKVGG